MGREGKALLLAFGVVCSVASLRHAAVVDAEEIDSSGSPSGYGLAAACSEPYAVQFQVTQAPSTECGSSGSKFYVSMQAEYCLRSAHVICTIGSQTVVDGDLYTSPGILVWLDRSLCVSNPARFLISPSNPMTCKVTTQGGWISPGTSNGSWTTYRTPCCDTECGWADRFDLGEIELCAPDDLKMVFEDVTWCDSVHLVRLVCEVPQDDPSAFTYYHWLIHGEIGGLDRTFCFRPTFPGQPTECWLISYGGQFTGSPAFFTNCTDCDS